MAGTISTVVSPLLSEEAKAEIERYHKSARAKAVKERLEREMYGRDKRSRSIAKTDLMNVLSLCKGDISDTAKVFGVPPALLRKAIYRDPELLEIMNEAREQAADEAEKSLKLLVENGNAHAVIFTLKTLGADRGYGTKRTVEHEIGARAASTAAKLIEAMRRGAEVKALPEPKEETVWEVEGRVLEAK